MQTIVNTPEECIKILSCSYSTSEELFKTLEEASIAHKFKLTKTTGNKSYFYFECYKSGKPRSIEEAKKIRDRNSIKTGFYFL